MLKSLLKILPTAFFISITSIASAENYYYSFGLGNTTLTDKTHDWNEDHYPYKFSTDAVNFKAVLGKHINKKFDLSFEIMTTSKFNHRYSGPIVTEFDGTPWIDFIPVTNNPTIYAAQNIRSTTILLQGKYKYKPYFFSDNSHIYGRTGIGLALNTSSDYTRNIMNTFKITYPGNTNSNLGFSIGLGVEKTLGKVIFGVGYDCYSVGSFQTKNKAVLTNLKTGATTITVGNDGEVIGKRLRPINTLLHNVSFTVGVDF